MTKETQNLLAQIVANPDLPEQLQILHDLALYESGDALLGVPEKEALFVTKQLAEAIKDSDPDEIRTLL